MQVKTSKSDPIQINWIELGLGWGRIGMTLCPGKSQIDGISGVWERDLKTDLDDIRKWGAKHVFSLITQDEESDLQVLDLAEKTITFMFSKKMSIFNDSSVLVSIVMNIFPIMISTYIKEKENFTSEEQELLVIDTV